MLERTKLSPRARRLAAAAIHEVWDWVGVVGVIGPDDHRGRRFRSMGPRSCIAFPPGALLNEYWISIGAGTLVGPHVSLGAGLPGEALDRKSPPIVRIGGGCNIGRGSSLIGRLGIEIGDDVTTGPGVYVTDHNHTYADLDVPIGRQWMSEEPVRIGAGSWLGAGVIVLPGSDIGRHVTVAAGSVVRGVLEDNCVAAGSPARIVRRHVHGVGWVPDIKAPPSAPAGWPRSSR